MSFGKLAAELLTDEVDPDLADESEATSKSNFRKNLLWTLAGLGGAAAVGGLGYWANKKGYLDPAKNAIDKLFNTDKSNLYKATVESPLALGTGAAAALAGDARNVARKVSGKAIDGASTTEMARHLEGKAKESNWLTRALGFSNKADEKTKAMSGIDKSDVADTSIALRKAETPAVSAIRNLVEFDPNKGTNKPTNGPQPAPQAVPGTAPGPASKIKEISAQELSDKLRTALDLSSSSHPDPAASKVIQDLAKDLSPSKSGPVKNNKADTEARARRLQVAAEEFAKASKTSFGRRLGRGAWGYAAGIGGQSLLPQE